MKITLTAEELLDAVSSKILEKGIHLRDGGYPTFLQVKEDGSVEAEVEID